MIYPSSEWKVSCHAKHKTNLKDAAKKWFLIEFKWIVHKYSLAKNLFRSYVKILLFPSRFICSHLPYAVYYLLFIVRYAVIHELQLATDHFSIKRPFLGRYFLASIFPIEHYALEYNKIKSIFYFSTPRGSFTSYIFVAYHFTNDVSKFNYIVYYLRKNDLQSIKLNV